MVVQLWSVRKYRATGSDRSIKGRVVARVSYVLCYIFDVRVCMFISKAPDAVAKSLTILTLQPCLVGWH